MVVEAIVGAGGVLHVEQVPFEPGTRVQIVPSPMPAEPDEDWGAFWDRHAGSLAHIDFDLEDQYPEPIEPLHLAERQAEP